MTEMQIRPLKRDLAKGGKLETRGKELL